MEASHPYCNQVANRRNSDLASISHLKSHSQVYVQAQAAKLVGAEKSGDNGAKQTEQALVFQSKILNNLPMLPRESLKQGLRSYQVNSKGDARSTSRHRKNTKDGSPMRMPIHRDFKTLKADQGQPVAQPTCYRERTPPCSETERAYQQLFSRMNHKKKLLDMHMQEAKSHEHKPILNYQDYKKRKQVDHNKEVVTSESAYYTANNFYRTAGGSHLEKYSERDSSRTGLDSIDHQYGQSTVLHPTLAGLSPGKSQVKISRRKANATDLDPKGKVQLQNKFNGVRI